MEPTPFNLTILALGSVLIGLNKTGIPGVGILAVGIFTLVFEARASSGFVLPLLILADIVAVWSYWRDARWGHLLKLFPWAIAGVLAGYFTMGHVDSELLNRLIGVIILCMAAMQGWRSWKKQRTTGVKTLPEHGPAFAPTMGIFAGFTTMVANAAGPIMNLYLIAMQMPKYAFMGTAAWYFFLLNSFKVPFSVNLGLVNWETLKWNALLSPLVIIGALTGRWLLPYIPQALFEGVALVLAAAAALRLVVG